MVNIPIINRVSNTSQVVVSGISEPSKVVRNDVLDAEFES